MAAACGGPPQLRGNRRVALPPRYSIRALVNWLPHVQCRGHRLSPVSVHIDGVCFYLGCSQRSHSPVYVCRWRRIFFTNANANSVMGGPLHFGHAAKAMERQKPGYRTNSQEKSENVSRVHSRYTILIFTRCFSRASPLPPPFRCYSRSHLPGQNSSMINITPTIVI